MGYVIAAVIVILLVAGFITYLVMNAASKRGSAAATGDRAPGIGTDATPLGDTGQHAGEQTERGTTADDVERNPGQERGDDSPPRPERPEDRQLRDAGAGRR